MTIGDIFTQTIPTVGDSGTQYASDINDVLTELIDRVSSSIPFSALSGDSMDMSNVPLKNAKYLGLYNQSVSPGASPNYRFESYGGEVYWVNTYGALKLTNAGHVNAASIGGIGGDYGGVNPALVTFIDAASTYKFYDDSGTSTWGYITARGFNVAAGATSVNLAQIRYAGASTITFTLPATLPSNRSLLVMSTAGQIASCDNTNTVDSDIVLSGSIKIQHGTRTLSVFAFPSWYSTGTFTDYNVDVPTRGYTEVTGTGGGYMTAYYQLPVLHGWKITGASVFLNKADTTAALLALGLRAGLTGVESYTADSSSTTASGAQQIFATGWTTTVSSANCYFLRVKLPAVGDKLYSISVSYQQDA